MLTLDRDTIREESKIHVSLIKRELVANFGKTTLQARELVRSANVLQSLLENPIGLHDSPRKWALIVLNKNKDYDTLDKYFYSRH